MSSHTQSSPVLLHLTELLHVKLLVYIAVLMSNASEPLRLWCQLPALHKQLALMHRSPTNYKIQGIRIPTKHRINAFPTRINILVCIVLTCDPKGGTAIAIHGDNHGYN